MYLKAFVTHCRLTYWEWLLLNKIKTKPNLNLFFFFKFGFTRDMLKIPPYNYGFQSFIGETCI